MMKDGMILSPEAVYYADFYDFGLKIHLFKVIFVPVKLEFLFKVYILCSF